MDFHKRGRIYWVDLPINPDSHIQGGVRPCVIVSSGWGVSNSEVITVCPLTTKLDSFVFHPKCFVRGRAGQILCEQIVTIDVKNVGDYIGTLSIPETAAFNKAMALTLGLDNGETL